MTAVVIVLGCRFRQRAPRRDLVRVWCPFCGAAHIHPTHSDRGYGRCPTSGEGYFIRVTRLREGRLRTREDEALPLV